MPAERRRWGLTTSLGLTVLLVGVVAAGSLSVVVQQGPLLAVSFREERGAGSGAVVAYTVSANRWGLPVHVGVVSGHVNSTAGHALDVWYDPSSPPRESSANDLIGLEQRLVADFAALGRPDRVQFIDTPTLTQILLAPPGTSVAIIGAATPPLWLFTGGDPVLRHWMEAGGTLYWAGAPVGYWGGPASPNATCNDPGNGWFFQLSVVGFPLVDPTVNPTICSGGPLFATRPSTMALGLGLSYAGAGEGANVTQVVSHGGVVLGDVAPSPPGRGAGDRTSIAYVPIGLGGLYYFGGAISSPGLGNVPDADLNLSDDLTILAGSGFVPNGAAAVAVDLQLGAGATQTGRLDFAGARSPLFAIAFVRIAGNLLALQIATFPS